MDVSINGETAKKGSSKTRNNVSIWIVCDQYWSFKIIKNLAYSFALPLFYIHMFLTKILDRDSTISTNQLAILIFNDFPTPENV